MRALLDEVFGADNFVNTIVYRKTSGLNSPVARTNTLPSSADVILWYARDLGRVKYRPLYQRKSLSEAGGDHYRLLELSDGTTRPLTSEEVLGTLPPTPGSRAFQADNLISQGHSDTLSMPLEFSGRTFRPPTGSHWKTTQDGLARLALANRLLVASQTLRYRRYFDDFAVMGVNNVWTDIGTDPDKTFVV